MQTKKKCGRKGANIGYSMYMGGIVRDGFRRPLITASGLPKGYSINIHTIHWLA